MPRIEGASVIEFDVPTITRSQSPMRIGTRPHLEQTWRLGVLPTGTEEVDFDVEVIRQADATCRSLWRTVLTVPVEVGGQVAEVVEGDASSTRMDGLARSLSVDVGSTMFYASVAGDLPVAEGATFAVKLELLHQGECVAFGHAWWAPTGRSPINQMRYWNWNDEVVIKRLLDENAPMTLVVHADPETALRDFDRKVYWTGEMRLPVRQRKAKAQRDQRIERVAGDNERSSPESPHHRQTRSVAVQE
jgi:hypothetical protein